MAELVTKLDVDSFADFISGERPALVDFWAAWCGPCKIMSPIVDDLSLKLKNLVSVGKLNVDEEKKAAHDWGITKIPTLILFKNGVELTRLVGYYDQDSLVKIIQEALSR